jgi:L-rhamnose isomerase
MTTSGDRTIQLAYEAARQQFSELGVDADEARRRLAQLAVSIHCWQGDDVSGFESSAGLTDGGIQATGNYPGKARNGDELRQDLEQALQWIPGQHRVNLHALYAETAGKRIERDQLQPEHFAGWVEWARQQQLGLDFNPSYFSHPRAADGFTLASSDEGNRRFWVDHGIACRKIGLSFGQALQSPCVTNFWIPDGYKDLPADRRTPRERLQQSLDEIFAEPLPAELHLDAVECKLFGIGSESYVVGSHEFYLGYAIQRRKVLCLDSGHFHPTESIADKISAVMLYVERLLLHVSRGVRWDSDHVVIWNDDVRAIAEQLVRGEYLDRTHLGLDFFDASINRVAAWVIGARSLLKALLAALLEPHEALSAMERDGDYTGRLALQEELKSFPVGAVWDYHCLTLDVPPGRQWLDAVRQYERKVLAGRIA